MLIVQLLLYAINGRRPYQIFAEHEDPPACPLPGPHCAPWPLHCILQVLHNVMGSLIRGACHDLRSKLKACSRHSWMLHPTAKTGTSQPTLTVARHQQADSNLDAGESSPATWKFTIHISF